MTYKKFEILCWVSTLVISMQFFQIYFCRSKIMMSTSANREQRLTDNDTSNFISTDVYRVIMIDEKSESLSNTRLDSDGLVCSLLDTPGVRSRSEPHIYFRQQNRPPTTLVVFAYYHDSLGQDNLQFFLAQGLVHDSAYHFVIVINGPVPPMWEKKLNQISTFFPNFEWHSHENIGYDFCIYKHVLSNRMQLKISIKDIQHFVLLNKSLRGPFVPSYYDRPWPDIFTSRLNDKIKLSGTSINCGNHGSGVALHIQSMLWAFSADLLPHVLDRFDCYQDKTDAIMKVEVGFPAELMAQGFRVASTMLMLDSKEGVPDENTAEICAWSAGQATQFREGDQYYPGAYAGIDLNPLEMVFFKTNRNVSPHVLRQYSIFALMNKNFTLPARVLCST
jgi:hypothetical protein